MQIKTKKIIKIIAIILSILFVAFIIFIALAIYFYSPGYPPNDRRKDHSYFKDKKLKIPKEIYKLEPNNLGLFIRNYQMFKDYDTSQIYDDYTIYQFKEDVINFNDTLDTNIYYNNISFTIDDKSFIQGLSLVKTFSKNDNKFQTIIKDSIHNYVKRNFKILNKYYSNKAVILLDKSNDYRLPDNFEILFNNNDNLIVIRFPNIYDESFLLKQFKFDIGQIIISFDINANENDFIKNQYSKMKNVTHLYNPKAMGWE